MRFAFFQRVSNYLINRIKKALAECVLQETQLQRFIWKKHIHNLTFESIVFESFVNSIWIFESIVLLNPYQIWIKYGIYYHLWRSVLLSILKSFVLWDNILRYCSMIIDLGWLSTSLATSHQLLAWNSKAATRGVL